MDSNAEAPDAVEIVRIWPGNGVPPGAESWTQAESTMQVPWATRPRGGGRQLGVTHPPRIRPALSGSNWVQPCRCRGRPGRCG